MTVAPSWALARTALTLIRAALQRANAALAWLLTFGLRVRDRFL